MDEGSDGNGRPPEKRPERRSQSSHPASFPLYWRDWLSDPKVRAMSRDMRGGFLDVLCFSQGTDTVGVYTEDQCQAWAGYPDEEWKLVKDKFLACHSVRVRQDAEGTKTVLWVQKRARRERLAQKNRYRNARKAGKKGARKRWEPKVLNSHPITPAMAKTCPSPDPSPSPVVKQQAMPSTEHRTGTEATARGELAVAGELTSALLTRLAGSRTESGA